MYCSLELNGFSIFVGRSLRTRPGMLCDRTHSPSLLRLQMKSPRFTAETGFSQFVEYIVVISVT
jgi:hypothetical protein